MRPAEMVASVLAATAADQQALPEAEVAIMAEAALPGAPIQMPEAAAVQAGQVL